MVIFRLVKKMSMRTCKLCCIENSHLPINLPHGVAVIVGRSHATNIRDSLLSRNQISLVACTDTCTVKATPLGSNPCGVNGFSLKKDSEYVLKHKDRLELLLEQFVHEIIFDPEPDYTNEMKEETNVSLKRRRDSEENDAFDKENSNKQQKIETLITKEKKWEEIDEKKLMIFTSKDVTSRSKIAAYDVDGTIINTKSGAKFAKDSSDWELAFPIVPKRLQELHDKGFKIVFFTNQMGIANGKLKRADLQQKIENIVTKLSVPVQVFISPTRSIYRKPVTGMWDALCKEKNDGIKIDLSESFYCGDAAGRNKNWAPKKKKDHSIADRLFALNVGINFYTPEEHFLGARKVAHIMPEFDPRILKNLPLCEPNTCRITSDTQEVIIFVGSPGSGKSFVCLNYLVPKGYIHVNRDKLGSWQKCVTVMEKALQEKKSVVIDNTNPDTESRKRYVAIAKKYSIPSRCFVMNTSVQQAKHNNLFRELTDKTHQPVADIILNSYKSKYQEPNIEEGFDEVVKINCLIKFENPEHEDLYHKFLLEK